MSGNQNDFTLIGLYMVHWSSFELAVDLATVKASRTSPADVVRKTGGWDISKKVLHFLRLVESGSHPHRAKIIESLRKIPSQSIRNSIAHSYMRFGPNRVIFIHRKRSGKVNVLRFTSAELQTHLKEMTSLADDLSKLFGNTEAEAETFVTAVQTT